MSDNFSSSNGPGRPKDLAKRQAILNAAKDLFLTKGYASTSMDAVAAEAGVSKLTVYSHFNDKETLFTAAIRAKCETQLPELMFELSEGASVESVLRGIGQGFVALINSDESLNLHRLIVALGNQDPKLSQIFFEAGPLRVLEEMEQLLVKINKTGVLVIDNPHKGAEHFFCLLKGAANFRLLLGCGGPLTGLEAQAHVDEVVGFFMRAYRP